MKPVRHFQDGHQNRSMQIGFEISNCYRYLVTGSECRSAYIYDIGSGKVIEKTKNAWHGDAVTDVSFNPVYNEWATSSIDGHNPYAPFKSLLHIVFKKNCLCPIFQ